MKQGEFRRSGGEPRRIKPFVAVGLLLALSLECTGQTSSGRDAWDTSQLVSLPATYKQTPSGRDRWDAVQQLLPGDDVAVRLKDGRSLKGKVAGVTAAALTLSRKGRIDDVAKQQVKTVHWLAPRSKQLQKRWAGAGGLGGFLGGVVTAVALSENTDSASKAAAGIAVVGGLLGGALLGWKLGGRRRRVLVYEAN